MPSAFKSNNIEALERRRENVDREITGLLSFRDRIDRRIEHLKSKPATITGHTTTQSADGGNGF